MSRGVAMRRVSLLFSLLVVVLVGLVLVGRAGPITLAQGATPSADESAPPEGVSFVPLGFGTADKLPATPADFVLAHFMIDPGASFALDPNDPSVTLAYVESGTFTFNLDAPITVTRAATIAAFSTPDADPNSIPAPEEMAAGTEFTMGTGDSAFFPANISGEIRNDGQEQAVAVIASVGPPDGGEAGTPTP